MTRSRVIVTGRERLELLIAGKFRRRITGPKKSESLQVVHRQWLRGYEVS